MHNSRCIQLQRNSSYQRVDCIQPPKIFQIHLGSNLRKVLLSSRAITAPLEAVNPKLFKTQNLSNMPLIYKWVVDRVKNGVLCHIIYKDDISFPFSHYCSVTVMRNGVTLVITVSVRTTRRDFWSIDATLKFITFLKTIFSPDDFRWPQITFKKLRSKLLSKLAKYYMGHMIYRDMYTEITL